ncbi:hypothetical protein Bbelb_151330 [Branchiostoma belcheri]|nr:hypothetical protein Bbelb_151330 [Branchiostoma belcheri]
MAVQQTTVVCGCICEQHNNLSRSNILPTPAVQIIWHDPVSVLLWHVDPAIPAEGETIHFSHFLYTSLRVASGMRRNPVQVPSCFECRTCARYPQPRINDWIYT